METFRALHHPSRFSNLNYKQAPLVQTSQTSFSVLCFTSSYILSSKMEKISETAYFPHFSLDGGVGLLLFHIIFNWVIDFQKIYVRFLSKVHDEKQSSASVLEKKSIISSQEFCLNENLRIEDVEFVMEKLGLSNYSEESGEKLDEFLGFNEISNMFEEKEPSLEELKAAFYVFDENRDGFIDPNELQKVLFNLGFMEGFKVEECESMIRVSDENGDGRIDFNEFVKFMESSFS